MPFCPDLLETALTGDRRATRAFVDAMTPIIAARVRRVLRRSPAQDRPAVMEELVQDVFLRLFGEQARVLRAWNPEKGLSLDNYVGMVAERFSLSFMNSGRRSGWREEAREVLPVRATQEPEAPLMARDLMRRVLCRMESELSPRAMMMLRAHVLAEGTEAPQISRAAVHKWRSRLMKEARRVAASLEEPLLA